MQLALRAMAGNDGGELDAFASRQAEMREPTLPGLAERCAARTRFHPVFSIRW